MDDMDEIEIFREMIKDEAKVPLIEYDKEKRVVLTESQYENPKDSRELKVAIGNMPDSSIVIKADVFRSPDTIFTGNKGECKRADFVIVSKWTDTNESVTKIILIIELKAGRDDKEVVVQQLKGAQCFIGYCREIGRAFWKKENFLDGYEYRFVGIYHISAARRKTRYEFPEGIHDSPEKMLKISSPTELTFMKLVGGEKNKKTWKNK